MFVSFNVEELFVYSTFFPEPMNRSILKYLIDQEVQLLRHSYSLVPDSTTKKMLDRKIVHAVQLKEDLNEFFPNIKIKESILQQPSPRISGCSSGICFEELDRSSLNRIKRAKARTLERIERQLKVYDPLQIFASIASNMSTILDRESFLGLEFFRTLWESKNPEDIISKISSKKELFQKGFSIYEFQEEISNETYRQILLTSVDMQRRIRHSMAGLLSCGQGNKETSFLGLLTIADLLFSADALDRIIYHLEIDIPVYVVEGKTVSLFIPQMSKLTHYPYHVDFNTQYNRLAMHYASSVEPEMAIPYLDLILERHEADFIELATMLKMFRNSNQPIVLSPSDIHSIVNDPSILSKTYNPFVMITNSDGEWFLTAPIMVHDSLFRFVWSVRKTEHFKRIGSSFEESVEEQLSRKFPDMDLERNVLFHTPRPEKDVKKHEIDIMLQFANILICIECKDYVLIEDPDDFKLIAERIGLLSRDAQYFDAKINRLIEYFDEFSLEHSQFAEAEYVIPLILVRYPDLKASSNGIPTITQYELTRLVNFLTKEDIESIYEETNRRTFQDISDTVFEYKILRIKPKRRK